MPDMTLKVIGAGLGRTGTHSAQLALNQLGFPCYHMVEVIRNKDNKTHLDFYDVANRGEAAVIARVLPPCACRHRSARAST